MNCCLPKLGLLQLSEVVLFIESIKNGMRSVVSFEK